MREEIYNGEEILKTKVSEGKRRTKQSSDVSRDTNRTANIDSTEVPGEIGRIKDQ